ncbi:unnamed protein product, partial [Didymodactylos carnosus]
PQHHIKFILFTGNPSVVLTPNYVHMHTDTSSPLPVLIIEGGVVGLTPAPACTIAKIPFKLLSTQLQSDKRAGIGIIELSWKQWTDLRSRVKYIGDSAHAIPPNLALGGILAVQDSLQLASELRTATQQCKGTVTIKRGHGWLSCILAGADGASPPAKDAEVSVTIQQHADGSETRIPTEIETVSSCNCAGPFQFQNYYVAETCVQNTIHYIDLADSRAFVTMFPHKLHQRALQSSITLISGASAVPGLSSAVCLKLSKQYLTKVEVINIRISP